MYTPRALFSRLFLKICFFVLSFYTIGRLVTLAYEISFKSPSLQIRVRGQSMICVHTMLCGYVPFEVFQDGRWPPSWI